MARYSLVILSNQGGISFKPDPKKIKADQKRLNEFKGKVNAVIVALDLPITIYAATAKDQYRKPRVGMWQQFLQDSAMTVEHVDLGSSFFVGDAGGRPAASGSRRDFSCSDRYRPAYHLTNNN